ncbi:MAG: ABC transporter ATP-binding protein [Planctomycetaceae bacterium]|nr:ABC transporter ATP-binding protein [Planctomycetaceae bacterium]
MVNAENLIRTHTVGEKVINALRSVSFHVSPAEQVSIVGRSGSGKSTLLNLLAGLDRPDDGTLTIGGLRLDQLSHDAVADYRLRTVGIVFQSFQLVTQRTAMQNVELPLILAGVRQAERRGIAEHWLERVGLAERRHHLPGQLSGGEQQRTGIARALANQPRLILADEPTGNLDSATAGEIVDLLMQLCADTATTSIVVTHDPQVAQRCGQRLFHMADGRLQEVTAS